MQYKMHVKDLLGWESIHIFISLNEYNYPHVHWSQTRKLLEYFSWPTWRENSIYYCLFLYKLKAQVKLIKCTSLVFYISEE